MERRQTNTCGDEHASVIANNVPNLNLRPLANAPGTRTGCWWRHGGSQRRQSRTLLFAASLTWNRLHATRVRGRKKRSMVRVTCSGTAGIEQTTRTRNADYSTNNATNAPPLNMRAIGNAVDIVCRAGAGTGRPVRDKITGFSRGCQTCVLRHGR